MRAQALVKAGASEAFQKRSSISCASFAIPVKLRGRMGSDSFERDRVSLWGCELI